MRPGSIQQTTNGAAANAHGKPADYFQLSQHRETKARAKSSAKITACREKFRMECVLEKPVAPLTESATCRKYFFYWSWRRDLNPRPPDYKSGALPTELRQQILRIDAPSRKLIPRIPSRCPGQLYKVPQGEFGVQTGRLDLAPGPPSYVKVILSGAAF
jgi:hypothetical protein